MARELLGKFLIRRVRGKNSAAMITEVEAYDGPRDKASHAHRGRTARNEPMFGEAGRWYVYFVYGCHWMLNIVTGPKNYPAAILIRGGIVEYPPSNLSAEDGSASGGEHPMFLNGPGKLTKFLEIDKRFNGLPASRKNGLWIEDRGVKISRSSIRRKKRIGVDYAAEWARKPYNFSFHLPVGRSSN